MTDELRADLAVLRQQVAALESEIASREEPLRAPQRALERPRDQLVDELLELERQWARLSADGRGEGPSPPALTVLRVSGFALCVGCLVALCGNLRDTGPRVLLGAALVTAIAALWGFLHER